MLALRVTIADQALILRPATDDGPDTVRVDGRYRIVLPYSWRRWLGADADARLLVLADPATPTITVRNPADLIPQPTEVSPS